MSDELTTVVLYVDPQCPFAWITSRWLQRVQQAGLARVRVELMSIACVNEGQDLDPDYRNYNEDAWAAARFSAALLASDFAERWPAFYDEFGRSRHVEGNRDNRANLRMCVRNLDLPMRLLDAADVPSWDGEPWRLDSKVIAV